MIVGFKIEEKDILGAISTAFSNVKDWNHGRYEKTLYSKKAINSINKFYVFQ